VWGKTITIPKNCTDIQIEEYKNILEKELNICLKKAKTETNA
jgi:hypothetical protein